MSRRWFRFLLFLCLFATSAPALAQPNGVAAKRAEIEARLKKWRGTILRKEVGLDEKKATDIEHTLDKFQTEREQVQKELQQQQKTLRALFDLESSDQGAYARALQAASVPVAVHPGLGLIHGCFDMLGVTAAARDEIDRIISSVREALAVMGCPRR